MQDKGAIEPVGRLVEQRDQLAPLARGSASSASTVQMRGSTADRLSGRDLATRSAAVQRQSFPITAPS